MGHRLAVIPLVALFIGAALAWPDQAHAEELPTWQSKNQTTVRPGQRPSLTLVPSVDVRQATLRLVAKEGPTKTFKFARIRGGKGKTVKWKAPPGRTHWTGTLEYLAGERTGTLSVELVVIVGEPPKVEVPKPEIDVSAGKLTLVTRSPLSRVEIQGFTKAGEQEVDEELELPDRAGRIPLEFDVPDEVTLRRLELKIHDRIGYWVAVRLVDFYVEIPHDDVVFPSGQHDIPVDQAPKLDAAIMQVQAEIGRFRKELNDPSARVDARLYVAGHTDTVGSATDNLALSQRRARAIAQYFKTMGLEVPVFYAGFGEEGLAVTTEDEVDEAKNRRARYILTNTAPRVQMRGRSWTRLK